MDPDGGIPVGHKGELLVHDHAQLAHDRADVGSVPGPSAPERGFGRVPVSQVSGQFDEHAGSCGRRRRESRRIRWSVVHLSTRRAEPEPEPEPGPGAPDAPEPAGARGTVWAGDDGLRRIFLVRHGRTSLNAAGVLRGRLDPALDDIGVVEAKAVADAVGPADLAVLVASPLQRAVDTAAQIGARAGLGVEIDERLIDRDYGSWAGRPKSELIALWGSLDAAPEVEPSADVLARAMDAFNDVARRTGSRFGRLGHPRCRPSAVVAGARSPTRAGGSAPTGDRLLRRGRGERRRLDRDEGERHAAGPPRRPAGRLRSQPDPVKPPAGPRRSVVTPGSDSVRRLAATHGTAGPP